MDAGFRLRQAAAFVEAIPPAEFNINLWSECAVGHMVNAGILDIDLEAGDLTSTQIIAKAASQLGVTRSKARWFFDPHEYRLFRVTPRRVARRMRRAEWFGRVMGRIFG